MIKQHYNVVVIGSGYGGAVAACRSARAGQSVCILEKGQEWLPGDFPETMEAAFRATYINNEDAKKPQGLSLSLIFYFSFNDLTFQFSSISLRLFFLSSSSLVIRSAIQNIRDWSKNCG